MHKSVLLAEVVERLVWKEDGVYVDATYGAGGHSAVILEKLGSDGRLIGLDRDDRVSRFKLKDERCQLIHGNFRYLDQILDYLGVAKIAGIMADLGVSSMQLDEAEYGMAYRFDNRLDMRMNRLQSLDAVVVLNEYDEGELSMMFRTYGEVPNYKQLASCIVRKRALKKIERSLEFVELVDTVVKGDRLKYLSQVFQSVRMEVNDELGSLERFLHASEYCLGHNGVLAVITFHSLEDRYVKNFMKYGNVKGRRIVDAYGKANVPFAALTKKPIEATEEERFQNRRARSAKLRVAKRK